MPLFFLDLIERWEREEEEKMVVKAKKAGYWRRARKWLGGPVR